MEDSDKGKQAPLETGAVPVAAYKPHFLLKEQALCARIPIGPEDGASKAFDGNHSVCQFESDRAHRVYFIYQ